MKITVSILFLMSILTLNAQTGQAKTTKTTFSRSTTVSQLINASPATVWEILTNAAAYSEWNSTIISLEGEIAEGEKIKLTTTLDPDRSFKLKVQEMKPNEKMVWKGAMGKRVFTLQRDGNITIFTITERIGGFLFPLFASKIPDFDEAFELFAADLKNEAETRS